MVTLTSDTIIDDKGRVCIPAEFRKRLNLKSGEKITFQVGNDNNSIIMRKSITPKEFVQKVEEFKKKLRSSTKEPIQFEKLLG